MSEYQYYEFLAIDRPLTTAEQNELRALSTRGTITAVSFSNEYQWGDFKGNPVKLMKGCFDAHVYVANFMTAIFMLRLPIEVWTRETASAVAVSGMLDIERTATHWVITWGLHDSEDYDRFAMDDGRGWMARLVPLRDELLRGDLRSLYIGWLAAVSFEIVDDDEMEPLAVSGLSSLTGAQQALAEFLEVDPDLLAGVGMCSPVAPEELCSSQEIDTWVNSCSRDEVNSIVKQLLEGKAQQAERSIKNRFATWQRSLQTDTTGVSLRTVEALRQNAETVRRARMERQRKDSRQREVRRRKEREWYLKNLSNDFPGVWRNVEISIERGTGAGYDEACRAIVDLSEAYGLHATQKQFQEALEKCMAKHKRRKALVQRLQKAGIWKDDCGLIFR